MPAPNTRTFTQKLARRGSRSKVQHGVKLTCVTVIAAFIAACAPAEPTPSQSAQSTAVESPDTNETSATDATEPRAAESATAEPTETPADGEALSPPVLPELAEQDTDEGAIAFAKYLVEVMNYSVHSGDLNLFDSLTLADCSYCDSFRSSTEALNKPGVTVSNFKMSGKKFIFGSRTEANVSVGFDLTYDTYLVRKNGEDQTYSETTQAVGALLVWESTWKLQQLGMAK